MEAARPTNSTAEHLSTFSQDTHGLRAVPFRIYGDGADVLGSFSEQASEDFNLLG